MNTGSGVTPKLSALGQFIRFYRRDRGLKQDELAAKVEVTKNTISQIERGRQWPSMQTYLRLIEALELPDYDVTDHESLEEGHRRISSERGRPGLRAAGISAVSGSLTR